MTRPHKLDKQIAAAIAATNAQAVKGLQITEGVCPKCGCPDVDLSYPLKKGLKCWNCGEKYQPFAGWEDLEWQ